MILGKAFGAGLRRNIEDAYKFLMDRFEDGDRVFIFGFSRGGHTARSIAGMLHKCGLLERGTNNLIPYASKLYLKGKDKDILAEFKAAYSRECKPHFVGVWDTVASMGWLWGNEFTDSVLNADVTYGYQAISVDEKRRHFGVDIWDEASKRDHQEIEQVWFPGVHADVGGWHEDTRLSDLALEWMLKHANGKGLRLKEGALEALVPDPSGVIFQSYKGWWRIFPSKMRKIPENSKIHESVFLRMEDPSSAYGPSNLPVQYQVVKD